MEQKEEIIFAARAYTDYGSPYETDYLIAIRKRHPNGEIIELPILDELSGESNIKYGKGLFDKERKHFFPLIDQCDILVCAPIDNEFNKDGTKRNDKGKLSEGVMIEAIYALSIGKKVFIVDINNGDVSREIKSISDSEELIKEIAILDRQHLLDEFPKMKDLMKTEKRLGLNIHPKMMNFYARNPKVRQLMKDFMNGNRTDMKRDEYVRPIVIHEKYPDLPSPILYLPLEMKELNYYCRSHYELTDFSDKYDINDYVGELHFRECIFDKGVKDAHLIDRETDEVINRLIGEYAKKGKDYTPWMLFKKKIFQPEMVFDKHVIGVCVVFDIDAPKELKDKVGKVDMFDIGIDDSGTNRDWYEEFMTLKCACEEWFKQKNLKCLPSSTGDGFNVTGEPVWFDERDDNLYDFTNTIEKAVAKINHLYGKGKVGVRIDVYPITWAIYKKMPFTYHAKWNRITLPVKKGIIDKEWLKRMSDLDYFLGDNVEKHIDEVIEKSKWDEYRWW